MGCGDFHENVPYVEENMRFFAIAFGTFLTCLANSISVDTATAYHLPRAAPFSAWQARKQCEKRTEWCQGYVSGMIDGMLDAERMNKHLESFCLPKNTNTEEIVEVIRVYLKNHPAKKKEDEEILRGTILIMNALHTIYPCKAP